MGGTRPLAIDNLVEVGGIRNIGLLQLPSMPDIADPCLFDRPVSLSIARGSRPVNIPKTGAILRFLRFPEKPFAFNH
jgi:hypothetical protein